MTTEQFNAHVADLPDSGLLPQKDGQPMRKRSEYAVTDILCSAAEGHPLGLFALGKAADGPYVAMWHCHADWFATEDDARKALNKAELELLTYKAHV